MDLQVVDPRVAVQMVMYKALSGFIMVAIYAVFEIATVYVHHWLSVPQQPLRVVQA